MKKAILKLEVRDDKQKKEIMDTVSGFSGVDSISMDMKEKKLTVIGDIDPVNILNKLMKLCHTEIVSVEPAKEPEKNDGKKKNDGKDAKPPPRVVKEDGQMKGYPEEKKGDGQMKGYGAVLGFDVDTSYNPHITTYNRPEITKPPPHPNSEDDDACACCACAIL